MADETNKTEAADPLDMAAADAVASQEQTVSDDVVSEETEEQIAEVEAAILETDAEGLPTDQGPRSDLGRKIAAIHRRQDSTDDKLERMLQLLESQQKAPEEELYDEELPLTRKYVTALIKNNKKDEADKMQAYNDEYMSELARYARDTDEQVYGKILKEMEKLKYDPSEDPKRDLRENWLTAKLAVAENAGAPTRENPLKGDKARSELGTVTNQKVTTKDSALPNLDEHAKSYLKFVSQEDGSERAADLQRTVAK